MPRGPERQWRAQKQPLTDQLVNASVQRGMVDELLKDSYFAKTPPKSLDRNHFAFDVADGLSKEDGAATLTEFVAAAVVRGSAYFPRAANQWFVSGGGRHNPALMQALRRHFLQVYAVESLGWVGDALRLNSRHDHCGSASPPASWSWRAPWISGSPWLRS